MQDTCKSQACQDDNANYSDFLSKAKRANSFIYNKEGHFTQPNIANKQGVCESGASNKAAGNSNLNEPSYKSNLSNFVEKYIVTFNTITKVCYPSNKRNTSIKDGKTYGGRAKAGGLSNTLEARAVAKRYIKRQIQANYNAYGVRTKLLTLTVDRPIPYKIFEKLFRKFRRHLGGRLFGRGNECGLKLTAVWELQENGNPHLHIIGYNFPYLKKKLFKGFMQELKIYWNNLLANELGLDPSAKQYGNVNLLGGRKGNNWQAAFKYLSAYLTKSDSKLLNWLNAGGATNFYVSSKGLKKPIEIHVVNNDIEEIEDEIELLAGAMGGKLNEYEFKPADYLTIRVSEFELKDRALYEKIQTLRAEKIKNRCKLST